MKTKPHLIYASVFALALLITATVLWRSPCFNGKSVTDQNHQLPILDNQSQSAGEISKGHFYLSTIRPADHIVDFYDAFSESMLLIVAYEGSRRYGNINKSNNIDNLSRLTKAYAILLALIEINEDDEDDDGGLLEREATNCKNLIIDLLNEFPDP